MALSAIGEDTIVYSKESDYAANIEKAEVVYEPNHKHSTGATFRKIQLMLRWHKNWQQLEVPVDEIVKTMIFKVDGEYIMVLVRGHHEINDIKLKSYFGHIILN